MSEEEFREARDFTGIYLDGKTTSLEKYLSENSHDPNPENTELKYQINKLEEIRRRAPRKKMKDEIIAGLKNALERDEPLEKAAQSFVNAGYNPQEVRDAVSAISEGTSNIIYGKNQDNKMKFEAPSAPQAMPTKRNVQEKFVRRERGKSKTGLIIIVILLLIIFLGVLGYLIYYLLS